ncbi:MAG: hypothetical protein AAGI38_23205, partial [Bacteroidota bacterium]
LEDNNFKIATLFINDSFDMDTPLEDIKSGKTGKIVPIDYKGKIIKNWKNVYMPWGNVSKRLRYIENRKAGHSYLKAKYKLMYINKVSPFIKRPWGK